MSIPLKSERMGKHCTRNTKNISNAEAGFLFVNLGTRVNKNPAARDAMKPWLIV